MFALATTKKISLVWKGSTLDNYTLQLTQSGLHKILSQLPKQPELKRFIKKNYQGNLKNAVVRSIAQIAKDALFAGYVVHPSFSRKLRVFNSQDIAGIKYQILTLPLSKVESAIVALGPTAQHETEEESSPAQCGYLLEILRKLLKIPADTPIGDAIKTIYTTDSKDNIQGIRFAQAQVKGKGTGMGYNSNKPDISFYHNVAQKRVNIEIDLDTAAGRTSSDNHEQNLITWDKNAVGIFLIVDPSSGAINHDRSRIYQPEDLTNPHLSAIAKDAIGDSYKIAVAKKVSDIGDGFQRKLQPV